MKKYILSAFFMLSLGVFTFASDAQTDKYDYDQLVTSIRGVQQPVISEGYIVFTADSSARNVCISFDFENYRQLHAFSLRRTFDWEGEETGSWYFYVLKIPAKTEKISYKLVIDGLWTTDPNNPHSFYDEENGIQLSYVDIPKSDEVITECIPAGFTKFVCESDPGQKIRLGGSFTNWDSWIYEMNETAPGRYEICLPLPAGTYYYAYFNGLKRFIDVTNPHKAYTSDGKMASLITIN